MAWLSCYQDSAEGSRLLRRQITMVIFKLTHKKNFYSKQIFTVLQMLNKGSVSYFAMKRNYFLLEYIHLKQFY